MNKYHPLQISLHWLVLLLVIIAYASMELREWAPRSARPILNLFHYSSGFSILLIMVVRLVCRMMYRMPAIIPKPHPAITGMSHLAHSLLYVLFIVLPVMGILTAYARGNDWSVFGLSMPFSAEPDEDREYALKSWHTLLANVGYYLIAVHAAGALFHHFIIRDNTLLRMMLGSHRYHDTDSDS